MSLCKLAPSAAADGTMWPLRQRYTEICFWGQGQKSMRKLHSSVQKWKIVEQTGGLHVCAWLNKHDLMEINPYPIAKNYGAGRYHLFI